MGEVLEVLDGVLLIAQQYRDKGNVRINLILMGDVVDRSIKQAEQAMYCVNLFTYFAEQFDNVYSLVGNHEQTYISNNPFWHLVSDIGDEELVKTYRLIQPKSLTQVIQVPAILSDGNVDFYFNHYGVPLKNPQSGKRIAIGLFHQNIGSRELTDMWGEYINVDGDNKAYFDNYNYCFFGHVHNTQGKYYIGEKGKCIGEWLGSAVRASTSEVQKSPLSFNVPAIIIEDDIFQRIEDNLLNRRKPEECIDLLKVEISHQTYEQAKVLKNLINVKMGEKSLWDNVYKACEAMELQGFIELLSMSFEQVKQAYNEGLNSVEGGTDNA